MARAALLPLLGFAVSLHAATPHWISNGPNAGYVLALASSPAAPMTLFGGTGGGIYKSVDGGAHWSQSSRGLTGSYIDAVAVSPTNPNVVYAGGGGGLWRTDDGGAHWRQTFKESKFLVASIAIDPTDDRRVYAGTNGGLFRSSDGGENWATLPFPSLNVFALAIDPKDPSVIYAGTAQGVFKSRDGGALWLPPAERIFVFALAVDPDDSGILFAGASDGVYRSSDGGATWTRATSTTGRCASVVIDPLRTMSIHAGDADRGVLTSNDGGVTWKVVQAGLTSHDVNALLLTPTTLFSGTRRGIFSLPLGGESWTASSDGLNNGGIAALAVSSSAHVIYAGGTELHRSNDGGSTWRPIPLRATSAYTTALAIDPTDDDVVYASVIEKEAIFKSVDGGGHWSVSNEGLPESSVFALAIDPHDPSTIYAGLQSGAVWKSRDGGAHWAAANRGMEGSSVFALAIDPGDSRTIWAGAAYGPAGLYRSTDGGDNWNAISGAVVQKVDSRAAGAHSAEIVHVFSLALDPRDASTIFAGSYGAGVWKVTEGGTNWELLIEGLPNRNVLSLTVQSSPPYAIFAGLDGANVVRSVDGGATWTDYSGDMTPALSVYALLFDSTFNTLFAGTGNGGVFATSGPARRRLVGR